MIKKINYILIIMYILLSQVCFSHFESVHNNTNQRVYLRMTVEYRISKSTSTLRTIIDTVIAKATHLDIRSLIIKNCPDQSEHNKFIFDTKYNVITIDDFDQKVTIIDTAGIDFIKAYIMSDSTVSVHKATLSIEEGNVLSITY